MMHAGVGRDNRGEQTSWSGRPAKLFRVERIATRSSGAHVRDLFFGRPTKGSRDALPQRLFDELFPIPPVAPTMNNRISSSSERAQCAIKNTYKPANPALTPLLQYSKRAWCKRCCDKFRAIFTIASSTRSPSGPRTLRCSRPRRICGSHSNRATFPNRFELRNHGPESRPCRSSLYLGLVGNRDSQHCVSAREVNLQAPCHSQIWKGIFKSRYVCRNKATWKTRLREVAQCANAECWQSAD